jgi:hypothetical protein
MDFEAAPIVKYIYNQTGELGGYPMVDILEKEMSKQENLGGKLNAKELGLTKFENLVIPAGLVSFSNEYYQPTFGGAGSQDKPKIKVNHHEDMDNELFNKVFDLITKCPKQRSKQNTKKTIEKLQNAITKKKR